MAVYAELAQTLWGKELVAAPGREHVVFLELMRAMVPPQDAAWRMLLSALYRQFMPSKVPHLDRHLATYQGARDKLYGDVLQWCCYSVPHSSRAVTEVHRMILKHRRAPLLQDRPLLEAPPQQDEPLFEQPRVQRCSYNRALAMALGACAKPAPPKPAPLAKLAVPAKPAVPARMPAVSASAWPTVEATLEDKCAAEELEVPLGEELEPPPAKVDPYMLCGSDPPAEDHQRLAPAVLEEAREVLEASPTDGSCGQVVIGPAEAQRVHQAASRISTELSALRPSPQPSMSSPPQERWAWAAITQGDHRVPRTPTDEGDSVASTSTPRTPKRPLSRSSSVSRSLAAASEHNACTTPMPTSPVRRCAPGKSGFSLAGLLLRSCRVDEDMEAATEPLSKVRRIQFP
mmetsp:Transcript_25232/g.58783  ORF Transcript_25232/g.58783 Transcript_25232/m.58783 type:complete len:402 (-) Transcript_25232:56-1261(-)